MDPALLIPHRPPWLLLDSVEVAGDEAHGRRLVSAGDPLAAGPDGALPQVLVVEALAQTAAAVMGARRRAAGADAAAHRGYLVEVRGMRFGAPPRPGAPLELHAAHTAALGRLHRFQARATQDGTVIAEGTMSFAVEET
ncbi:MAG TPA: 3-hydroxyacyl-[acyl-carrier-protein] dehydratase FabZ [Polyangia bacterium]